MIVRVSILCTGTPRKWMTDLQEQLLRIEGAKVEIAPTISDESTLIFLDEDHQEMDLLLESLAHKGRAVFLVTDDERALPEPLINDQVDDVLVYPFRMVEIVGKLSHYQRILEWEEVAHLNESFGELMDRLQLDLSLAERLQRSRFPQRFPNLKGFKAKSRYLAGMRPGGDYLDLAESSRSQQVSILLTDSSTYGLSSAFLGSLMKVAARITNELSQSSQETVQAIFSELVAAMGAEDELSLFYGVLERKSLKLNYVSLGSTAMFLARPNKPFEPLLGNEHPLTVEFGVQKIAQKSVQLQAEDRLVLISDGFVDYIGSPHAVCDLLNDRRDKDPIDLLNEFVYRVKSQLDEADDLPAQDCTALVLDLDSNVVPLKQVS